MTDLKSVSDTFLNKSILRKALDLFTNKFIKKTDNSILNEIVGLVRKVRSVNTILNKLSSRIPLNKKERKFFANHEAFFNYARNAVNQVSYSKSIDNVNNQEVNYTYERTNEFRRLQEESRRISYEEQQLFHSGNKEIDETLRRRLSRTYEDILRRESSIASNGYGLLENTNNFKIYKNVNGQLFHDIFEINKKFLRNGELVDLHDDYSNVTCYLSENGLSGFAIEENGNLVSVFNLDTKKGFLRAIANEIQTNAKILDCYNSVKQPLNKMYSDIFGFKTASIMDYNMEYDHDNIAVNHNEPQVAFMVNTSEEVETRHFNKDQYDEAQAYQLSYVNKQNANSVDLSKVKIGSNGKIVRDNITEPLFEIANDSINIAKDNFNFIKKELFTDIATKYNLSLEITDINGNKLSAS